MIGSVLRDPRVDTRPDPIRTPEIVSENPHSPWRLIRFRTRVSDNPARRVAWSTVATCGRPDTTGFGQSGACGQLPQVEHCRVNLVVVDLSGAHLNEAVCAAGRGRLPGRARPAARRPGRADVGPGARPGCDDRGRVGAAVHDTQWAAVETGLGDVHAAALAALAPARAAALADSVTIDLDTTDVEVYGRHKRGVAFNHQGQRVGRPHVACWADTATVLAADLLAGNEDPRRDAPALLRRALAALPAPARTGRIRLRADAGYFAGQLARAALFTDIQFAIGARRIAPLWRLLDGLGEADWTDAIDLAAPRSPWPTTARTGGPPRRDC